ncbi:MAG: hypothetical protein ABH885_01940 [Candidatus Omnitrophota bacterium]
MRKSAGFIVLALVVLMALTVTVAFAATQAKTNTASAAKPKTGAKETVQKVIQYPANVVKTSVGVVTDTATKTTNVVSGEVKNVGAVATGDMKKTKDLVMDPLTGTAETAKSAVEGTVCMPVNAAKE